MTTFRARMIDSSTGGEGIYDFEESDDLLDSSPVRVIRKFMEHVGKDIIPHSYEDYELNAAFKNKDAHVVTGLGTLILHHMPPLPFAIMIAPKSQDHD